MIYNDIDLFLYIRYVYLTVDDFWNLPDRDEEGNMMTNLDR